MIVREATLDDVPALVRLARGYFDENAQWGNLTFSAENAARSAVHRIMSDDSFVLVAGDCIGVAVVSVDTRMTVEPVAFEEMFYIHKSHRHTRAAVLLARAYVKKSLEMGAKRIYTSSTAGFGALQYAKLMQRLGFKIIENGVFLEYGQV